jgi:hypothetical protein
MVQRHTLITRFLPCSDEQLMMNSFAATWPEITPDLRTWLAATPAICASGRVASPENDMGTIRWSSAERHVVVVHRSARTVTLTFAASSGDRPLAISVDGERRQVVISPAAPTITLPLTSNWRTWLRRGHRIDIDVGRAGGSLPELREPLVGDAREDGPQPFRGLR